MNLEMMYLGVMQVYTVHGELLGIFQKLCVGLGWSHSPERAGGDMRQVLSGHMSRSAQISTDNPRIITRTGV